MFIQLGIVFALATLYLAASGIAVAAPTPKAPVTRVAAQPTKPTPQTAPNWTGTITSPADGQSYLIQMIGSDPNAPIKQHTRIDYAPIALRVTFPDGTVLDPSDHLVCTSSGAPDGRPVWQRVFHSPLFVATPITSNGVDVSAGRKSPGLQLIDAYVRANFWSSVKNTDYGVLFHAVSPTLIVNVKAPRGSVVHSETIKCGNSYHSVKWGEMPDGSIGKIVQDYQSRHPSQAQLTVVTTFNVGEAISDGYTQLSDRSYGLTNSWVWGAVVDLSTDDGGKDIYYIVDEIEKWITNPLGTNTVPGYKLGPCGAPGDNTYDLDVDWPIRTREKTLQTGSDNFTYHFSDIAFFDYFFRSSPLNGTGSLDPKHPKYSFMGDLKRNAGKIRP